MTLHHVNTLLGDDTDAPVHPWRLEELVRLSGLRVPDYITGTNDPILKADVHSIWLRWFVEGICSPSRYVGDEAKGESHVLADALDRVNHAFSSEPRPARDMLAMKIAKQVMAEVNRRRLMKRKATSPAARREMIDAQEPRCWICGYRFSDIAIDVFLNSKSTSFPMLPELVDIFRPRGLHERHIRIEVEHIVPVAAGGGSDENLALACGWCNHYKGARTSLYDTGARPPRSTFAMGALTLHELPHPFWTVRLAAIRQSCGHIDGCTATTKNSELFIALASHHGSPNPSNLRVFCEAHDPHANDRYIAREEARKIWDNRVR